MDLENRLNELYDDLGNQEGELKDSGALGKVFNGLLDEVREQYPDDPVIGEIEKMGFNFSGHTASSAESLRTVVGQMRTVVRGDYGVGSAERVGFEPTRRFDPPTRFPVAHLKPLGHLSGRHDDSARNRAVTRTGAPR